MIKMKISKNHSTAEIKGTHILTCCRPTTDKAIGIVRRIRRNIKLGHWLIEIGAATDEKMRELWEEYRYLQEKLEKLCKTQEHVVENTTCTTGRSVLIQRLANTTTYTGIANYCALGDDNTAETESDATLGNETTRKAVSSRTYSSVTAYLETFFEATEAVDTHEEYGYYIDGTASVDTGQLFNRFTEQVAKSNTETLNVQSVVELSDA